MNPKVDNHVVVIDIKMSFMSMVVFMVKWVIASIPAFLILAIIGVIIMFMFGFITAFLGMR